MTFATPVVLLGLLVVPLGVAGYVLAQRRRRAYAVRFTNLDLLATVATGEPRWRRHVPAALFLGALGTLVVAGARPSTTTRVPREQASVVLAIDRSGSMRANDVDPTRMDAAQDAAARFVDSLPRHFQVGLVTFANTASVESGLTTDHGVVRSAIDALVANGGTAMGDALERAVQLAGSARGASGARPTAAVVLLSDGADTTSAAEPLDVATEASRLGVPVYTIALGTDTGIAAVPDRFGTTRLIQVPPDRETLEEIASTTGGRAFDAPTESDLAAIYDGIGSRIGWRTQRVEVTTAVAALAALLLVVAGVTSLVWFGRLP